MAIRVMILLAVAALAPAAALMLGATSGAPVAALAKCSGKSPCKACTDCSRCAHCKGGGSCGICSKPKRPRGGE